jgi:hypothetical protein
MIAMQIKKTKTKLIIYIKKGVLSDLSIASDVWGDTTILPMELITDKTNLFKPSDANHRTISISTNILNLTSLV